MELGSLADYDGDKPSDAMLLTHLPTPVLTNPVDVDDEEESSTERRQISMPCPKNQVGAVISKIEDIFESIADCILEERKELVIALRTKSSTKRAKDGLDDSVFKGKPKSDLRNITFPSRNPQEAWKFGNGFSSI